MSEMIAEYGRFKELHAAFNNGEVAARPCLQAMFQPDAEGVLKLMLFWAASCLNFGSKCRTKCPNFFGQVLVPGWRAPDSFKAYIERLEAMGIKKSGEYSGRSDKTRDRKLLYIQDDANMLMRAGSNNIVYLPLFNGWFEEAKKFADELYPSGILSAAMDSIHKRALEGKVSLKSNKSLYEMLGAARPERQTVTHRLKGEGLSMQNLEQLKTKPDAPASIYKETTMSKTSSFIESVKGVFGNVLRMQRGRAAVHAAKRVIFAAFPIKWGILARLTGKAKKVEDHPLTDVAVALAFHGAASALLSDPQKRSKYLKFTEEMVAASVANAGLKMVPVEEMLDKVMNGALDSEAVGKLKAMLQDSEE